MAEEPVTSDLASLVQRNRQNADRSRRALGMSIVALIVVCVMAFSSVLYFVQQSQIKKQGEKSDCRAALAAEDDGALTELLSASFIQPVDRAAIQNAIERRNVIKEARKSEDPCRSLKNLPDKLLLESATTTTLRP